LTPQIERKVAGEVMMAADNQRLFTLITLGGLPGVSVGVEDVHPVLEQIGLTRNQFKADVEQRLAQAGIRVLSMAENLATPGHPVLFLVVHLVPSSFYPDICMYSIRVELSQAVTLVRDPSILTVATTWHTASAGHVKVDSLPNLRKIVAARIDDFINDYLSMRPVA